MKKLLAMILTMSMLLVCSFAAAEDVSLAGTYTYNENVGPFSITWTLDLKEDNTYILSFTKPTGVTYTYTGVWVYHENDATLVTGTPNEDTSDIEAGFFRPDYSAAWIIDGDTVTPKDEGNAPSGSFSPAESGMPGEPMDSDPDKIVSNIFPGALAGTSYAYDEVVEAYGFTVHWTLTFDNDSTATLISPNDLMGDSVYSCTWKFDDGLIITKISEITQGRAPLAPWFDAANDYECKWVVYQDGTMIPYEEAIHGAVSVSEESDQKEETVPSASSTAGNTTVAYASGSGKQVMDIYTPSGDGPFPMIVVVHGGGFMFGDQKMEIIQPIIAAALDNGYAVASVDYRKSSDAVFPAAVGDVKAAVRFVRANAEKYSFDADHIAVWGESAGAYLSLMTALTPGVADLNADVSENMDASSQVTALVSFYAPVQFATMTEEAAELGFSFGGRFECQFLGVSSLEDEKVADSWWKTYADQLPESYTLKAWIQAGTADTNVPYTQSVNFAKHLTGVIGDADVQFSIIEGAAHEDPAFYTEENLAAVFEFLNGCMK